MRANQLLSILVCVAAFGLLATSVSATTLTPYVDYSDTFTVGVGGRTDGLYIDHDVTDSRYNTEYARSGLPAVQWHSAGGFSFNSSATVVQPQYGNFGGNTGNAGAATGMAQTGGDNWSINYGVRTDYTVESSYLWQNQGPVGISSWAQDGSHALTATGGLTVEFRKANFPEAITLWNGVTRTYAGFSTDIPDGSGSWADFGVRFNQDADELSIYVGGTLKGTLDLATFAGGIYADYSNAAVGMGGVGGTGLFWGDNFVVGGQTDIPEPSAMLLLATGLFGLLAYAWRKRK